VRKTPEVVHVRLRASGWLALKEAMRKWSANSAAGNEAGRMAARTDVAHAAANMLAHAEEEAGT
jgi:hypothetical protein